jgi:Divergent InlB B-repeat domain
MFVRTAITTAVLALVLAAGASASKSSVAYLTVQVGSFDAAVTVDPPSPQPPECSQTECRFAYESGTTLTLTAAPTSYSSFVRWSRGCSSSGTSLTCTGRIVGDTAVLASFSRVTVWATAGKGGRVDLGSALGGCGDGCRVYGYGGTAVVTASADPGYHIASWSGACSGSRTTKCTISNLSRNFSIYVAFARNDGLGESRGPIGTGSQANVGVSGQGTVSGQVAAQGFRCGTGPACRIYPSKGSTVALTANPSSGWKFNGWTGRCSGKSKVCIFMNQPWPSSPVPTVQAAFVPA